MARPMPSPTTAPNARPLLDGPSSEPSTEVMTRTQRRVMSLLVLVTLVVIGVSYLARLHAALEITVSLFLMVELGVAPLLVVAPMRALRFAVLAMATSVSAFIGLGYLMALTAIWIPVEMMVAVVIATFILLVIAYTRDLSRPDAGRASTTIRGISPATVATIVGFALVLIAALTHRGEPQAGGLFRTIGPVWYVGLAALTVGIVLAFRAGRSPMLPILTLSGSVVFSQAIAYGTPAVMSAARHVGVIDYIRVNHKVVPNLDIYQTWSGLFGGTAWVADVAEIPNALAIATWWPVYITVATTAAVALLAARFLPGTARPWMAAAVFALVDSVNTTYFSPQSVGLFLGVAITALAVESSPYGREVIVLISGQPARRPSLPVDPPALRVGTGRIVFIAVFAVVSIVTHEISPYLTAAALVVLVLFRVVRPWWLPLVLIVPSVTFALLNTAVLGNFINIAAVGQVLSNVKPPQHSFEVFPQPLITRLAFDVPAVLLFVTGLVMLGVVLRRRNRLSWALLLAAASPITLLVASNYGQEGIFRAVLFATPWLSILAAGVARPRRSRLQQLTVPLLSAGLVVCVFVFAFGTTALDWNRVMTPSEARATTIFENTTPAGSTLLLTGTGNAVPGSTTANYLTHSYMSRESLGDYPVHAGYNADRDVSSLAKKLLKSKTRHVYALVATPIGAYDARYGFQYYSDYLKLAKAMSKSSLWKPVYDSGTTVLYELKTSRQ